MNTIDIVGKGTLYVEVDDNNYDTYVIKPINKLPDEEGGYRKNEEAVQNVVYYAPRMYDFLRQLSDKGMLPTSMGKSFRYIRDTIEGELDD